jgi:hypothetical protein
MTGPVFEFLKAFDELTGRRPWSLVEEWEHFVAECEQGYHWNEYEYRNDGHCRAILEKTLFAPEMEPFPEQIRAMKERVFDADERLRALFIPGVQIGYSNWDWWKRGVLRNGVGEYAEDMRQNGIDLGNPPEPQRE